MTTTNKKIVVKTYKGKHDEAVAAFKKDSQDMATRGYIPVSQNWAPGAYGCGAFLVALLLCFVIIGLLAFVYMLIVKPDGTLTVNYQLDQDYDKVAKRKCPHCGEMINRTAVLCRYCKSAVKPKYVDDVKANDQLIRIRELYNESLTSEEIAKNLNSKEDYYLNDNSLWTSERVSKIVAEFFSD